MKHSVAVSAAGLGPVADGGGGGGDGAGVEDDEDGVPSAGPPLGGVVAPDCSAGGAGGASLAPPHANVLVPALARKRTMALVLLIDPTPLFASRLMRNMEPAVVTAHNANDSSERPVT